VIASKYAGPRERPAQPGDPRRSDHGGELGFRRRRRGSAAPRSWRSCPRSRSPPTAAWCATRPDSWTTFRAATPFSEIASLNIGSRPASRKAAQGLDDPARDSWVFSWSQCRVMLPGWYGFGTAVSQWLEKKARRARGAARDAPRLAFLPRGTLEPRHGARQVRPRHRLALRRARPPAAARRGVPAIEAEWHRTRQQLFAISGASDFLADNPRSRARSATASPTSTRSTTSSSRCCGGYRAGDSDERTVRAIHLTINGIAAALP